MGQSPSNGSILTTPGLRRRCKRSVTRHPPLDLPATVCVRNHAGDPQRNKVVMPSCAQTQSADMLLLVSKALRTICRGSLCATSPLFRSSIFASKYNRRFSVAGSGDYATIHLDSRRSYQIVVAATRDMGIGKDGKLPWKLPSDLNFFKEITSATSDPEKQNAVVMGRKTWESIPLKYRPLHRRLNVVLTRSESYETANKENNVVTCGSISSALQLLAQSPYCFSIEKVFVIGGGQIFRETLGAPGCDAIHITQIETSIECDTFIPYIDLSLFRLQYSSPPLVENSIRYSFVTYVRVRDSENGTDLAATTERKCN